MSITIQQAIDKIQLHRCNSERLHGQALARGFVEAAEEFKKYMEAEQMAIDALREKAERENPQPLTIEELKQMVGWPVWVQGPGLPQYGRWAIVEDAFGNSLYLVNDFTCHNIGKTWFAYRHKPKEE